MGKAVREGRTPGTSLRLSLQAPSRASSWLTPAERQVTWKLLTGGLCGLGQVSLSL